VPFLFAGLEIAVSNIVIAAIVGELLGTMKGLGHVIVMSVSQYHFPLLMAAVIVTTVMSILITWIFGKTGRILFKKWL
jgi:NitT/TauT family transport system permease protein